MTNYGTDYQALAHAWAYAGEGFEGSNYGNRMFATRDKIYSYGYHFCIARKIRDKQGNVAAILFNSNTNSKTTNKQINCVRRALSQDVIYVDKPDENFKIDDLRGILIEVGRLIVQAQNARTKKDDYLNQASVMISNVNKLRKLFKVKGRFNKAENALLTGELSFSNVADASRLREEKLRRGKREEIKKEKEELKKWLAGKLDRIYLKYQDFDRLRIRKGGEYIETTQGLSFILDDCKKLYCALKSGKRLKGRQFMHFTIIGHTNELLTIGCHKLKVSECLEIGSKVITC